VLELIEKPFVVACVPAFNEEKTIAKVVLMAKKHSDRVVVCDDGSTDLTSEIAESLGAEVVRHKNRLGYGAALQSLFQRARELGADVIVTLDADGQHNPEEIPTVIEPILEDEADVVIGSRFIGETNNDLPRYRRWGISLITKLAGGATNNHVTDAQSGFRAYNKKAIGEMQLKEGGMGASAEILLKTNRNGLKVAEVPIDCRYKGLETSTHSPITHGLGVIMCILRLIVEEKPLVFIGVPGGVSLFVGVLFGFWILQIYTVEHQIPTNMALASVTFVLMGLFAIFTAVTLFAITRLSSKLKQ
jgi:glycosyltransferase involved in cell wall biosynthesis